MTTYGYARTSTVEQVAGKRVGTVPESVVDDALARLRALTD